MQHFTVTTLEDWKLVAETVAQSLTPGSILALSGPLGVGKTTFVQALALALGASRSPKSPTFALVRSYPITRGKLKRLVHVDAYRIDKPEDMRTLNLDEELGEPGTVMAIEWPENAEDWINQHQNTVRTLSFSMNSDGSRTVIFV